MMTIDAVHITLALPFSPSILGTCLKPPGNRSDLNIVAHTLVPIQLHGAAW